MIYLLDESGDLGWSFDQPYRRGGSSRYFTIAGPAVPRAKKHLPKRVIKSLYQKFSWPVQVEKKWADMEPAERVEFAKQAAKLSETYDEIVYHSITVEKQKVMPHIRKDPNKLYNYMVGLSLLKPMAAHSEVHLTPDARSVKVASGNSLHDYLQTKLWFDKNSEAKLVTKPEDSSANPNLQFADMLAGAVQGRFEDGKTEPWDVLEPCMNFRALFFTP